MEIHWDRHKNRLGSLQKCFGVTAEMLWGQYKNALESLQKCIGVTTTRWKPYNAPGTLQRTGNPTTTTSWDPYDDPYNNTLGFPTEIYRDPSGKKSGTP